MSQPSNNNNESSNQQSLYPMPTSGSTSLYPTVGYQWNGNVGIQEPPHHNQPGFYIVPVPVPVPTKSEESTPLLSDKSVEAKISRKEKVVKYAKSRGTCAKCCCITFCCCCCLVLLIGGIIGAIFAAYAVECSNLHYVDSLNYTASAAKFDFTSIDIHNLNGDISIEFGDETSDDVVVYIDRYGASPSDVSMFNENWDYSNGKIYFEEKFNRPKSIRGVFQCAKASIKITIPFPKQEDVTLNAVTANGDVTYISNSNSSQFNGWNSFTTTSVNGDVTMNSDIIATTAHLQTTNGEVKFQRITSNQFIAQSVNGKVTGTIISKNDTFAPTIEAKSTNGNVKVNIVSDNQSQITLETVNGDVSSSVTGFYGDFSFKTTNGDVDLDNESGININYDTNSDKSKTGTIGTGSGSFKAKSTNGNVDITV